MKKILPLVFLISTMVFSQSIKLDTNYGTNGYTTFDSKTTDHMTYSASLNDGSLLVSASRYNTTINAQESILVKYDATGVLDTSFANKGIYVINHEDDNGVEVFVQENGKIYLFANVKDSKLFRLDSDGTLDTTFGNKGEVSLTDNENRFSASKAVMLNDGFVFGSTINFNDGQNDYTEISKLRKYDFDGNLITQFGKNGEVNVPYARILINLNGNDVIIAQEAEKNPAELIKINSEGVKDASFGNNGVLSIQFTGDIAEFFRAKTIDGKIYLSYLVTKKDRSLESYVLKYDINGKLISNFGENGKVIIANTVLYDLDDYNNNLYFVGFEYPNIKTVMYSYNYNGVTNNSFANDGVFIGNNKELSFALYPKDDSFIVVGSIRNSETDVKHYSSKYNFSHATASNNDVESLMVSFTNPVENTLVVNSKKSEVNSLEIYSLQGKLITTSNTNILKTNTLSRGMYILNMQLDNGKVISKKIIKN